jgi:NAD-dependent SIR2 family protein deacetylase
MTSDVVNEDLVVLARLVADGDVVVLTGAGLSTESGIPDYRGPTGLARGGSPMTYQEFIATPQARQRYWARSHLGWRTIAEATPNRGHLGVTDLQRAGRVTGIITQNVDGLHRAAGAGPVIELHGCLDRVRCLGCRALTRREDLDRRLRAANANWSPTVEELRPDGDAAIAAAQIAAFVVVDCELCGGLLKPDVVFFGENVDRSVVDRSFAMVETAAALVVLGSSLTVMSGFRFVRHAARLSIPVVIVNQGPTRGDVLATIRIDAPLGEVVPQLAEPYEMALIRR